MRRASLLAIALAVGVAPVAAKPRAPAPPRVVVETDFWSDVIEPHGEEVKLLVQKARTAMKQADDALRGDAEWAVDQRMRYFQDAYGILRYARTLSPHNVDVLAALGRAADELGKTRVAREALEAAARLLGHDRSGERPTRSTAGSAEVVDKLTAEVAGRLGALYVRLGERDAAIRYLRLAQQGGATREESAHAIVHLANALAARGDVPAAIDALANAGSPAQAYYSYEQTLVTFTLAVVLDRDEQRAAAFEVLDRMRSALSTQFAQQVQTALATLRYAPAEDQHYYLGLLYEVQGQYVEARAEFATYAATPDATWRGRALEHVHAIDAERRAARPRPKAASAVPPPAIFNPQGIP